MDVLRRSGGQSTKATTWFLICTLLLFLDEGVLRTAFTVGGQSVQIVRVLSSSIARSTARPNKITMALLSKG